MTVRPLVRKRDGWWRIYVGHSRYMLPDYYTRMTTAISAATHIAPKETSR